MVKPQMEIKVWGSLEPNLSRQSFAMFGFIINILSILVLSILWDEYFIYCYQLPLILTLEVFMLFDY